jgi:hypothetical protein
MRHTGWRLCGSSGDVIQWLVGKSAKVTAGLELLVRPEASSNGGSQQIAHCGAWCCFHWAGPQLLGRYHGLAL